MEEFRRKILADKNAQDRGILAGYLKWREEEVRWTMLAIFDQGEAEATDRRSFRKEITVGIMAGHNTPQF